MGAKTSVKNEKKEDVNDVDVEIEDVGGVGPTKAKQLRENGIATVSDLATAQMDDLAIALNVSKETAMQFINAALELLRERGILNKQWTPASVKLEKRKVLQKITTGSKLFDKVLGGGIETQAVTEIYGEYGSGKSQVCHTLCAIVQQPIENGGLAANAIFIDTEGTFRADRLAQIAETRGMDVQKVLEKTFVADVYNSGTLELTIKEIGKYIKDYKARLVIVDSLTSQFRSDYIARGTLADRQQHLNQIMHKLLRSAAIYNVAVVVTNQVMSKPDTFFGDPIQPVGGHVVGHGSTYRVYLKKTGHNRIATMVDSPGNPYASEKFTVTEVGVTDIVEEKRNE